MAYDHDITAQLFRLTGVVLPVQIVAILWPGSARAQCNLRVYFTDTKQSCDLDDFTEKIYVLREEAAELADDFKDEWYDEERRREEEKSRIFAEEEQ